MKLREMPKLNIPMQCLRHSGGRLAFSSSNYLALGYTPYKSIDPTTAPAVKLQLSNRIIWFHLINWSLLEWVPKKSPSLSRLPVQFTIKLSTFLIFAVCGPASSNILPKSPKGRRGSEAQMPSEKRNHKNNSTNLCMKRRFPCVHSVKFLM